VWGSSVPAAPCAQVSSAAQTVSAIQSGVNIVVYPSHMSLPFHRIQIWMANVSKVISFSNKGLSCTWTQWAILPSPEGIPWMMCQWLEQIKRRSKRRIYLKMFLRVMGHQRYSCHCSQQWGFPSPHPMVCFPRISPHHIQLFQTWSCFQPVSFQPKTASHLMCLTIFTWMPWECKTAGLSFFQKLRGSPINAAPASVPVWSSSPINHLVSLLMGSFRTSTESCYVCPSSG